jgi:[methyl-Co(III) methanol-specific corrinoid protein]:coenzyme M methyltransferase
VKAYEEAGADIITFHEMGASNDNISPKHFEEFVKPYLKDIIKEVRSPSILNICGSTTMIVDKMVECGTNAIAVDERTPIKKVREAVDKIKPGFPIIGNVPSYRIIHQGPVERINEAVKRCIADGVDFVAPGCDVWLETPTEHIKAFVNACTNFGTL